VHRKVGAPFAVGDGFHQPASDAQVLRQLSRRYDGSRAAILKEGVESENTETGRRRIHKLNTKGSSIHAATLK
jgi:hypothetical protein